MKQYEITFITRENLEAKDNPVAKEIESSGGKTLNILALGEKPFAYPIKKEKNGFYTTCVFEIEPEKLAEFSRKLGLKEEILRYLIIMAPKIKIPAPAKISEKKPPLQKEIPAEIPTEKIIETPTIKPMKEEETVKIEETPERVETPKPVKPAKPRKEIAPKPKIAKTETADDEQERLEALDKKLDELLKE